MQKANEVLEQLSADHALVEQLRRGDLSAFERLDLRFDKLYLSPHNEDGALCAFTCLADSCIQSCVVTRDMAAWPK